ncbi:hypothetical protein TrVFT333_009702 [Trichoderma virens FT-333]|nr:hypothetical protein TrVFT333_009702 [Trichoderma virens FT-333]
MRQVRSIIMPKRRALVKASSPVSHPDALRDIRHFTLVLATDSSYLVDCMCDFMPQWTLDETEGTYYNRRGDAIKNSEGFKMLYKETELLSYVGVQVKWYHIPRGFNCEADALANAALRK